MGLSATLQVALIGLKQKTMADITGTAIDDSLAGTSSADSMDGLDGNDTLGGGLGDDTLDGGAGYDVVDYSSAVGRVTVNLATGTASGADGFDILIGIEDIWGSDFDDTLTGDAASNVLRGRRGNDTLDGGASYDVADYSEAAGPVTVNLATGTASGADGNDVLISIEDIWGSSFDDILIGDANDNILFDYQGDDVLAGGLGDDTIEGGEGVDTAVFTGERAAYTITGTPTGHTVSGPDGTDTLTNVERFQFADQKLAFDLDAGEAAGNAVRIIVAAFGAENLVPEYVGIGLDLFDSGMSVLEVCQLALGTPLYLLLAGSSSNVDFVNMVYENVVGVAPSDSGRDFYVGLLQGNGGTMTQAELLMFAANTEANALNIDLVGLQQSGVEFV